jgi:hypothetical protein
MKKAAALLISLIASFVLSNHLMAQTTENSHPQMAGMPLTLTQAKGDATHTVSVATPYSLEVLLIGTQEDGGHHKFGDGFSIDWGDGTGDGDDYSGVNTGWFGEVRAKAKVFGTHDYSSAGTYTVKASMYDFTPNNPSDRKVYWTGTCTATVQ